MSKLIFFERKFPSANMILIQDRRPILIDTGFGSDATETEQLIQRAGVSPGDLHLIINTHYHSDHVGGNHYLQKNYGVPIAAHKWDAHLINSCDSEACSAQWLDQTVEQYRVDKPLVDYDEIDTGSRTLQVLHTPGHTLGSISLYDSDEEVLFCGDLFHENDVGWLNVFREGVSSIHRSLESLDRLAKLPIKRAYSGHGSQIDNPLASIDSARNRLEKWLTQPDKVAWHACKRIFSFTLIMKNGLEKDGLDDYLLRCGWFQDFARYMFMLAPEDFIQVLLDEMIRSKAASWQGNRLVANAPFNVPENEWLTKRIMPQDWQPHESLKVGSTCPYM